MQDKKPTIGVLFFTSGWFRDVGLQDSESDMTAEVSAIGSEIVRRISDFAEPVYNGVLFDEHNAEAAGARIAASDADGVIVSALMWCEDQIVRAALGRLPEKLKRRMLVCTFFPVPALPGFLPFHEMLKGSGVVGSLQMSGFLKREGFTYRALSGHYRDDGLYAELHDHCAACAVAGTLKNIRCGILPFRCGLMSATYVDEFALRAMYGIGLTHVTLEAVKDAALSIPDSGIQELRKALTEKGHRIEVDERNFREGARYSLALEQICSKAGLNVLAMNDIAAEMHASFGLRPCLDNPRFSDSGAVIAMEADAGAGIAMHILRSFTGERPFYTEIFTADLERNAFLMGHAGYHDASNGDSDYPARVISDVEYIHSDAFSGACTYFKYKSGPVTAVNCVYDGARLRWTVFEGTSLPGPPVMEGNCHLLCAIDIPVNEILRKAIELGVSQHWIVIHGRYAARLDLLCGWLNIGYNRL